MRLSLALLVLAGCSNPDSGPKVDQAPPVVRLTAPATAFLQGETIRMLASVEDDAYTLSDLTLTWSSSVEGPLTGVQTLLSDTELSFDMDSSTLTLGSHVLTLAAENPDGLGAEASTGISIVENEAPTLSFSSPTEGGAYPEGESVSVEATVGDPEGEDPASLSLSWGGAAEGDSAAPDHPDSAGVVRFSLEGLSVGGHELSVAVQDSLGATTTGTVAFEVVAAEVDGDGDGYPAAESGGDDCDDGDASIHPSAAESCNSADDDCDGEIDEDAVDSTGWYLDLDADGFGDEADVEAGCAAPDGRVAIAGDCDDADAGVNPDATESCDAGGVDEDCDGVADDADADVAGASTWYRDADGDGFGDPASTTSACAVPAGHTADATDCDDTSAGVNPGAEEACGGGDEDCDGRTDDEDDDIMGTSTWFADLDGDGFGTSLASEERCVAPASSVATSGDCDDANAAVNPDATEVCDGVTDEDCDGLVDDADPSVTGTSEWYTDLDGDGYGDASAPLRACGAPAGAVADDSDCDDADAGVNPGEAEIWYDGVDQDCAGADDFDQDADGHALGADCDDEDADVHPGAEDAWYDGIDADCDGADDFDQDADGHALGADCDDEDADVHPGAEDTWYDGIDADCDGADDFDQDGDGYDSDAWGGDDCDDLVATINPGEAEVWYDGLDQDCDGADDFDQDGDGVELDADCDDTDPARTGPEEEVLDGVDNDCDGAVDEVTIADAASGVLYGPVADYGLGGNDGLSLGGDFDGDGLDDLVLSTDESATLVGYAWTVGGADAVGAAGPVIDYDQAEIVGASSSWRLGNIVGPQVDVDGSSTPDLLIAAATSYGGRGYLLDGDLLSGPVNAASDASASFADTASYDGISFLDAADINGDGVPEIIVGSPYNNKGSSDYGADKGTISVFAETTFSGAYTPDAGDDIVYGDTWYDYLGSSLTTAEVTGDGYVDIIAGASDNDGGATGGGAVYVLAGNATAAWSDTDIDEAASVIIRGSDSGGKIGLDPMNEPADVDGDGRVDLLVTSSTRGDAWLFWDVPSLPGTTSTAAADIDWDGSSGAFASAALTDLDGDGAAEIYLGDPGDDTSGTDAGAVYRFSPPGDATGSWDPSYATATWFGLAAGDALGSGLAGGGDADGDGLGDLLVGASGSDGHASGGGAVYLVLGQ